MDINQCIECGAELDDDIDFVVEVDVRKLKNPEKEGCLCEDCAAKALPEGLKQ